MEEFVEKCRDSAAGEVVVQLFGRAWNARRCARGDGDGMLRFSAF